MQRPKYSQSKVIVLDLRLRLGSRIVADTCSAFDWLPKPYGYDMPTSYDNVSAVDCIVLLLVVFPGTSVDRNARNQNQNQNVFYSVLRLRPRRPLFWP